MKKNLLGFFDFVLLAIVAVMIYGANHRTISFSAVPNYDLLVREVTEGAPSMLIMPLDAMPEDEYYYAVSYKGGILNLGVKGYVIEGTASNRKYAVKCKPLDFFFEDITPNGELDSIPVKFSQSIELQKDDYWSRSITFVDGDFAYQVYFQSFSGGPVEGAEEHLEGMATALLSQLNA